MNNKLRAHKYSVFKSMMVRQWQGSRNSPRAHVLIHKLEAKKELFGNSEALHTDLC